MPETAIGDGAGATEAAYQRWQATLEGLYKTAQNTVGRFAVEFGTEMAPTIKEGLQSVTDWLQENKGEFKEWADDVGHFAGGVGDAVGGMMQLYGQLPDYMKGAAGVGLVGGLLFGPKGALMLASASHLVGALGNSMAGFGAVADGRLAFTDFATMNYEELAAFLADNSGAGLQAQLGGVRDKIARLRRDERIRWPAMDVHAGTEKAAATVPAAVIT